MNYSVCFYLHNNWRLQDDLAHSHLSHNREGFVGEHKQCYSVRVERGSFRSHNLTSHWMKTSALLLHLSLALSEYWIKNVREISREIFLWVSSAFSSALLHHLSLALSEYWIKNVREISRKNFLWESSAFSSALLQHLSLIRNGKCERNFARTKILMS
jgi:hypothetical protein